MTDRTDRIWQNPKRKWISSIIFFHVTFLIRKNPNKGRLKEIKKTISSSKRDQSSLWSVKCLFKFALNQKKKNSAVYYCGNIVIHSTWIIYNKYHFVLSQAFTIFSHKCKIIPNSFFPSVSLSCNDKSRKRSTININYHLSLFYFGVWVYS